MGKPVAWANSLGITAVLIYLVFWAIAALAPSIFSLIFNASFVGADVSSLYSSQSFASAIGGAIVLGITTWIIGYVWAWIYNKLAK